MFGLFKKRESDNPIERIRNHLRVMGYDLTPYGAGVALLAFKSGYSEVEAASHIAFTTMALDMREAGALERLLSFGPHAIALLDVLKQYKDSGMMHPTQWASDSTALRKICTTEGAEQKEWIDKILSDPVAGKQRLAVSRIK